MLLRPNYFLLHRSTGYVSVTLTSKIRVSPLTLYPIFSSDVPSLIPPTSRLGPGGRLKLCFMTYSWPSGELKTTLSSLGY